MVMPGNQRHKQPLERLGTYTIMVSTIKTNLERCELCLILVQITSEDALIESCYLDQNLQAK